MVERKTEGESKQKRERVRVRARVVAEPGPESTTRFSWQSAVKTCGSCKSCKITCSQRSSCGPCPAPCVLVFTLSLTSSRSQLDKDKLLLALPAVKFASDRMCWLRLLNLKFCSWFYFVVGPEKGIDHIFSVCVSVRVCASVR